MPWGQANGPCPAASRPGESRQCSALEVPSSSSYDVDNTENNHPHRVDKVPVHSQHFHAVPVLRVQFLSQCKAEHHHHHDEADDHVRSVQSHQRVKARAEEVSADSEVIVND